jgi:hypothetical protein
MDTVPEMLLESFILPAIKSAQALPENPQAVSRLQAQMQAVAQPQPKSLPSLPAMASSVSGKTYRVRDNSFGLESFVLDFSKEGGVFQATVGGRPQHWAMGLDNVYRITPLGEPFHGVIALRGSWTNDTTFTLTMLTNGAAFRLEFRFDEKQETVVIQSWGLSDELEIIPGNLQR